MRLFKKKFLNNIYTNLIIIAIIISFLIEIFSRHSIIKAFNFLLDNPIAFLCNTLIILLTLTIVPLFKRRSFVKVIICTLWLGFGIANGVILSFRVTPFTATDLSLISSALSIANAYLSSFQMILIILALCGVIIGFIYTWFKCSKYKLKINYKKGIATILITAISLISIIEIGLKTNYLASYFGNIAFAYLDYGFPYCFSNTLLNTGIDKPSNYSENTIKNIFKYDIAANDNLDNALTLLSSKDECENSISNPNIIMVQLESFFDPTLIKGLEFSKNPIPNFKSLEENFTSGYLNVPSVGAGTANTEFEVLSGMSLDFFGPGEYPYKTILNDTTCESINYDLKRLGYSTHAIHNNKGTFYNRDSIFSKLGFDTFTSLEYMNIEDKTPLGWAVDAPLSDEIIDTLNSTQNSDFVYTITVQSHGDYPKEKILENPEITINGVKNENDYYAFEYFVNQIHEVDKFIGDLVDKLSQSNEKTILVLFGDHLPTLGFQASDLNNNSIFQTEYIIWDNFNLPKTNETLEAYQLTSEILNKVNINSGILTKYHQEFKNSSKYLDNLKLLQYDMLYGKKYIYDGVNPYPATELKMGIKDIAITNLFSKDGQTYIEGTNFTPSSKIYVNNDKLDTTYINSSTLMVEDYTLKEYDSVIVKQVTSGGGVLSATDEYIYK